ncbi:MAG: hypothetical protein IAE96_01595 [Chitinophagaceae bacterium]|nr:hypothetical protein [Chitinophagaceae bacterium]
MELKQISKRLVIYGTLVIWTIKFFLRPFFSFEAPLQFFLGIAPNFLGSFLIPFGACWFFSGRNHRLARLFRTEDAGDLRQVCLLGFGLLVLNEYLQLFPVFGRTFDYFDILFSSVGLFFAWITFGRLQQKWQLA